jgi:hypothetical protein
MRDMKRKKEDTVMSPYTGGFSGMYPIRSRTSLD